MAVYREPRVCPFCGHKIPFSYNKLTKEQLRSGWCGDQGGDYVHSRLDCESNQRENKINQALGVTQSEDIKNALEFNRTLSEYHNSDSYKKFIEEINKRLK